jgi:hypothetical protein
MTQAPLEPGDLSTLSAFELGHLLNEVKKKMDPVTVRAIAAEKSFTLADTTLLYFPDNIEAQASLKAAKCAIKVAKLEMQSLNREQSRIQSILKSMRDA